MIDANNRVVKLCSQGVTAEFEGKEIEALRIFKQAYQESRNDYEACIAAHYVARHQVTAKDTAHWNQRALNHANASHSDAVKEFYPSLYLNLGWSYENLGQYQEANYYYELANKSLPALSQGREGISKALARAKQRLQKVQAGRGDS